MLSLVDFTDATATTEKLRLQNEELKKIAYLQSHIVRAPLANIEGIINLMDEENMSGENSNYYNCLKILLHNWIALLLKLWIGLLT